MVYNFKYSMARSNFSKVDEYGFERPENFNYEKYEKFMTVYMRVLTRRAQKWNTVLKGDSKYKRNSTVKRYVRKGIPSDLRVTVWMALSGGEDMRKRSSLTYWQLKNNITNNHQLNESIKIDLPRTFPDNIYFTNQEDLQQQLYNVLATFAHQNHEVGYCQGLNYIAGLLLLATKNEEASFWLLKALVEEILPKYYIKTMAGLLVDMDVLDELVLKMEPAVHRHIHNISMPWAMGVSKWFICIYSEVLPTETVLRIWDCLFYEGSKILFRVAMALIRIHKQEILRTSELGELITCFREMKNHDRVIDCHQFMIDVFKLPRSLTKNVEKLRIKYEKKN